MRNSGSMFVCLPSFSDVADVCLSLSIELTRCGE